MLFLCISGFSGTLGESCQMAQPVRIEKATHNVGWKFRHDMNFINKFKIYNISKCDHVEMQN